MYKYCLPLVLVALALVSCSSKEVAEPFPKDGDEFIVELQRVQFDPLDFNVSTFGNPLDMIVSLKKDGNTLSCNRELGGYLDGKRGERLIAPPIRWKVRYEKTSNYQIVLEETAMIASTSRYSIPRTPKLGEWPFVKDGSIRFRVGKNSYLQFEARLVEVL